jgi:hypothetical protein
MARSTFFREWTNFMLIEQNPKSGAPQGKPAILAETELLVSIVAETIRERKGPLPPVLTCPRCHGNLRLLPVEVDPAEECSPRKSSQELIAELQLSRDRKES